MLRNRNGSVTQPRSALLLCSTAVLLSAWPALHAHARDDAKHPGPGFLGERGALLSEALVEGHEKGRRNARVHVVLHPVTDVLRGIRRSLGSVSFFRVCSCTRKYEVVHADYQHVCSSYPFGVRYNFQTNVLPQHAIRTDVLL